ncbi:hypothetical protein TCAP_01121 [Tolypocladium capitatum]|uniref:Uncharacterized protein n=1 Tax=Tolypocladium capitatum TaxID=45235 RepID=A0A2K3QN50_9HYPO|nr:hypothetical protein TCAP_01121 [Tolypocladium capitatum]
MHVEPANLADSSSGRPSSGRVPQRQRQHRAAALRCRRSGRHGGGHAAEDSRRRAHPTGDSRRPANQLLEASPEASGHTDDSASEPNQPWPRRSTSSPSRRRRPRRHLAAAAIRISIITAQQRARRRGRDCSSSPVFPVLALCAASAVLFVLFVCVVIAAHPRHAPCAAHPEPSMPVIVSDLAVLRLSYSIDPAPRSTS